MPGLPGVGCASCTGWRKERLGASYERTVLGLYLRTVCSESIHHPTAWKARVLRSPSSVKNLLLDEVASIEKEWGLV
jgi:hypothetical protein